MRRDSEFFGDQDLTLVFIAKRLAVALKIEELLTSAGLDYMIETDTYTGGVVFRSERVGVFFYVAPPSLDAVRHVLEQNRYKVYSDG